LEKLREKLQQAKRDQQRKQLLIIKLVKIIPVTYLDQIIVKVVNHSENNSSMFFIDAETN